MKGTVPTPASPARPPRFGIADLAYRLCERRTETDDKNNAFVHPLSRSGERMDLENSQRDRRTA
jgi:hypothetical protein